MTKSTTGITDAVIKASSLAPAGHTSGTKQIARDLGVTFQAVQQWVKQGYVPLTRVTEIESLYGIPRHRLVNPKYLETMTRPTFDTES
jgi:DNA-binding transcriptional regulator YdaS (Cro superfamily)